LHKKVLLRENCRNVKIFSNANINVYQIEHIGHIVNGRNLKLRLIKKNAQNNIDAKGPST